jgi:hypothetical protein
MIVATGGIPRSSVGRRAQGEGFSMMTSLQQTADHQAVVWQAQGVLMELLGCEPEQADLWLRWRARVDARSTLEVAELIVYSGRLNPRLPV